MSEPCKHERDYTIGEAMKSYVAASALAGDAAIERDTLRLEVALLKSEVLDFERLFATDQATLAKVAAIVADPDAALVVDRIRGVLEPTPKGTKA